MDEGTFTGSQSSQRSPLNHANSNSNLTDCHFKLKQQADSNQNWGLCSKPFPHLCVISNWIGFSELSFSSPSSDRQMASPPRPRGSDVSALKESTPKASTSNEPDKAVLQASPSKSVRVDQMNNFALLEWPNDEEFFLLLVIPP